MRDSNEELEDTFWEGAEARTMGGCMVEGVGAGTSGLLGSSFEASFSTASLSLLFSNSLWRASRISFSSFLSFNSVSVCLSLVLIRANSISVCSC